MTTIGAASSTHLPVIPLPMASYAYRLVIFSQFKFQSPYFLDNLVNIFLDIRTMTASHSALFLTNLEYTIQVTFLVVFKLTTESLIIDYLIHMKRIHCDL